jgi:hypothetical protein
MPQTPLSSEPAPEIPPSASLDKLLPNLRPQTPQEFAIIFCALAIIAGFFAPWLRSYDSYSLSYSGATFCKAADTTYFFWIVPAMAVLTLLALRNEPLMRTLGTATALTSGFVLGYFLVAGRGMGTVEWGEKLTAFFSLALFAFSGDVRIAAPIDYIAKKLGSRKADVYSHSWTPTPDCHFSAREFYEELEEAIRAKQWPGVQLFRIDHSEGLFSHKREYLRVIRQRQLFDICAATFGKDYFFSVREAEIPAVITARAFITCFVAFFLALSLCVNSLGIFFGSYAMVALVAFAIWFLFNILKLGLTKVDSLFLQLPVIGSVYEAYFRRDTYFQQDTRIFFIHAVNELVKKHVEETTSAKGLKYLNHYDNQPVLEGLYKRSRVQLTEDEPAAVMT